jgi:aminopeptidase N
MIGNGPHHLARESSVPGQNLTRAEARERASIVQARSYDVELDLTTSATTFASRTTVRFGATPGASTFVDLIATAVHAVRLNGRDLDPTVVFADSRIALDGLAADNELVVEADCAYMNTGEGLHRFVDPVDGEVYLYSQFEVADSRRVYAVFEQPDLKATFAFTVTAPAHWTVISNSPAAADPEPVPGAVNRNGRDTGARRWTFATTPRISSYITAVVAGPYAGEHRELTSSDGRTIPLGVYCRASLAQYLEADEIADITRAGFAFYEGVFDRPYPFEKYDQIFVPEFNAGAMENAGAVTFVESYVFRSAVPQATVERRAVTVLHELAHMWFGDLVTMRWWDDLWLNESFAEFQSTRATAEATRWASAWTTFQSLEKRWAYAQDQLPSTHPIAADIRDLEDVEVNFDGITYAKGASVLRQLVAWVGQDEFDAGVRAYFAKHGWSNTSLADLLSELEVTSGRDLSAWSRLWLERAGVTLLRPRIETDPDGVITAFEVLQEVPDAHPVARPHRLAIGGYDVADDGTLVRTWREELDVDGPVTAVPALVGRPRPALVLVNDDDLAYARIRLDDASRATAAAHLAGFTSSLPRSLVLAAAWDGTRDGEMSARDYIDMMLRYIAHETDSTVVQVQLRQLRTALDLYVAPEHRAEAAEAAADRLAELLGDDSVVAGGSDTQLQLLKAFAIHASTPAQLDLVADLLDGRRTLPDRAIDTDLRWELLTSLVAGGRAGEAEIAAQLTADATATGERAAATARATLPTPAAKAAAWSSLLDRDDLPNAVQAATISGFGRVHDLSLLLPFVEPYFDSLEKVWAGRTNEIAQNIAFGLHPLDLTGDARVDVVGRTERWLAEHPDAAPALRRIVAEQGDDARRALAAQEADRRRG